MEGYILAGLVLLLAIFVNVASKTAPHAAPPPTKEGFESAQAPVPEPKALTAPIQAAPEVNTLPSASFGETSEVTSRPFQDPSRDKAPARRIQEVLQDMDGFVNFEEPKLRDVSDPAVSLPLTTFKSDRQRLQDEASFLSRNPGLQSSLTVSDLYDVRTNLSYLQKKARSLEEGTIEGFEDSAAPSPRATAAQIQDASSRISMEIARLQASGTTDPVYQARIDILSKINQQFQTLLVQLNNKSLLPTDVPITQKDLQDFLPNLQNTSKPLGAFLANFQSPTTSLLANLFPPATDGDIASQQETRSLAEKYGKGLSWNVNVQYTSPDAATAAAAAKKSSNTEERLSSGVPHSPAHFDWKERASFIAESIRLRGLQPSDFGCIPTTATVGKDFSWRGHAKMVCSRLQSTTDPALPEACGCPPAEWAGWKQ